MSAAFSGVMGSGGSGTGVPGKTGKVRERGVGVDVDVGVRVGGNVSKGVPIEVATDVGALPQALKFQGRPGCIRK